MRKYITFGHSLALEKNPSESTLHCVKSVQIRSFSGPYLDTFHTVLEYRRGFEPGTFGNFQYSPLLNCSVAKFYTPLVAASVDNFTDCHTYYQVSATRGVLRFKAKHNKYKLFFYK